MHPCWLWLRDACSMDADGIVSLVHCAALCNVVIKIFIIRYSSNNEFIADTYIYANTNTNNIIMEYILEDLDGTQ